MIELDGLPGTTPIGFMATLGLLRVLGEDQGLPVRLSWDQAKPRLHGLADREDLLSVLVTHMQGRHNDFEWNWADTAKGVTPENYSLACDEAAHRASSPRRALAFLSAWATDTSVTDDGLVRYTRLDMTSGRQRLIADLRKIAATLETPEEAEGAFHRALFGGPYEDLSSFGWDPATVRQHAHEPRAPTKVKPAGKSGWIWLAAESLAWHPVLPRSDRAVTTGCEVLEGQGMSYFWGLWSASAELGPEEVRFLRALDFRRLSRRMGVESLWSSTFGKSGNYTMLLPAQRTTGTRR
ncbi:type I-G CRISPR-associated protein, Cas3-extension family [Arhodomonas sp. AD133]|uniref:type I-G CRISPR-associated protein, Cas3-extension family n=1 Tax=Arhodomonas sp. AD133 TaxID=3415009 RepID=UPI003EBDEEAF